MTWLCLALKDHSGLNGENRLWEAAQKSRKEKVAMRVSLVATGSRKWSIPTTSFFCPPVAIMEFPQ